MKMCIGAGETSNIKMQNDKVCPAGYFSMAGGAVPAGLTLVVTSPQTRISYNA